MGRRKRIEFPGALYHVWARGNNRQRVFVDDEDRLDFISILNEARSKQGLIVYAFCLMENHFHLLVETQNVPLNRIMRSILTKFSKSHNRRHGKVGHLFQGRYKAALCERDAYLLTLLRYIHLNPVRAGLIKSPEDWLWSSYRTYIGIHQEPMLDISPILSEFDATSVSRARTKFKQFIFDGMQNDIDADQSNLSHDSEMDRRILGSGQFHQFARKTTAKPHRRSEDKPIVRRRIDDVMHEVAKAHGFTLCELRSASRGRKNAEVRKTALAEAIRSGWSQADVAKFFRRSEAWASMILKELGRGERRPIT